MEILKYGDFEIVPDIQKTKEYYSNLTPEETQVLRNFRKYCETMPEEERAFFESFGADPTKIDVLGLYSKKEKTLFCHGSFYVCGDLLKAEFMPLVTPEELLADEKPMASYKDMRFKIGNFDFNFEDPEMAEAKEATEGFVSVNFLYPGFPWLLDEKPEKDIISYEPPKKWEVHKRLWNAVKSKKAYADNLRESIKLIEDTLTECGIEFRKMGKGEYERYRAEWVKRFTPSFADAKKVRANCLAENTYLWHLFSYNHVHAAEGKEAADAFDETKKCKSILLCNWENKGYVLLHTYKLKAKTLDEFADVIVTSANFAWTYCKTHETECGPYFYRPKKK